ncbi:MAG TPA: hypothetical protein VKE96_00810 [Vicinamibacterales bacterium]|nr:hypothetical protein [Vicinamibacterales bacterium]
MRYARNLARGYGLVWNPGSAPVEGYTNPLWVAYMAAVHLLPIPLAKTSFVIQLTAAVLLTLNLPVVREIARSVSGGSDAVAVGAVVLTATYLPINNWSLQGMEVSVLVLVMSVVLGLALRSSGDARFRRSPYVLLGASTLVREDMAVPLAGLLLFNVLVDRQNRRRHLVWGVTSLVAWVTLQTAFRVWYFGDVLPNAYYLKMTGYPVIPRVSRGLFVLGQFVWRFNPLLFALPVILSGFRGRRTVLPLWTLAVQMLYSVWVGGDAWEYWGGSNRFIVIAMPGFFVMLSYALCFTTQTLLDVLAPGRHGQRTGAFVFGALIIVAVISGNSIYGPGAWLEALLLRAPLHTGTGDENHHEVEEALRLQAVTTADATVAVTRAGTIPYFSDRRSIDLLGKNDRHVAHEMSRVRPGLRHFREFRPGHTKFDYRYSIEQQMPDVVLQLWTDRDEVRPYLRRHYGAKLLGTACVYVRNQSPHVLQDRLSGQDCDAPP